MGADTPSGHELLEKNLRFMSEIPFQLDTGIEIVSVEDGDCLMKLPYDRRLVGNPDSGVLHGGIVTALLDACCGLSVFMKLPGPMAIATLDLRIDYLRPATAGQTLFARAQCYRMTSQVAFARATAFHPSDTVERSDDLLVATCAGTFMLGTKTGHADGKSQARKADS